MKGLSFNSWRNDQVVWLDEVVVALGDVVGPLIWRASLDELAPGPRSDAFEAAARSRLDTPSLLALTEQVQIIDGTLVGTDPSDPSRVEVKIRAVDSSWWDVETNDERALAFLKQHFPEAIEIPAYRKSN